MTGTVHHGPGWEVAVGDVLARLRQLSDGSVHAAITSPPYWGLRDYGVEGQIGLEPHPQEWLDRMVEVFQEVRRVLRKDGTLWLNVGDAFAQGGRGAIGSKPWLEGGRRNLEETRGAQRAMARVRAGKGLKANAPMGFKPKDLLGMPWRLALALQAAGWWLRSDIIWSKPNPMPESITDRPTKSHEYVFLLAPSETYFYDNEAVREPYRPDTITRRQYPDQNVSTRRANHQPGAGVKPPEQDHAYLGVNPAGRNRRDVWTVTMEPFKDEHFATFPTKLIEPMVKAATSERGVCPECGAPWKRIIAKGAQDADWVKACGANGDGAYHGTAQKAYAGTGAQDPSEVKARILASMRERRTVGWMPSCGCSPEGSLEDAGPPFHLIDPNGLRCADPRCGGPGMGHVLRQHGREGRHCGRCPCQAFRFGDPYPPVPAIVLDPFSGAATTGIVARRLGRHYRGIELNPRYAAMSARRLQEDVTTRAFGGEPAASEREKAQRDSQLTLFGGG